MKQNLHIYKTLEDLAQQFADLLMSWIKNHPEDIFHLAISGGNTPNLLFSVLAERYRESSLWQKVHFWWVDERMVPADDPQSNFGNANQRLLSNISIPGENIHRTIGENIPEQEAIAYSDQIKTHLRLENGWPVFDLILLGMGSDGHTASIFPNQMELLQADQICAVAFHPESGQKRVTLTGNVLIRAQKIVFLVAGKDKAPKLTEVFSENGNFSKLPVAHIKLHHGDLMWYVDKEASSLL